MTEKDRHPDLAELDALRTGEGTAETAGHVRQCEQCRQAMEEIDGLSAAISESYSPPAWRVPAEADRAVLAAIAGRAQQIRGRKYRWLAWTTAAASAAAAAFIIAVFAWNSPSKIAPVQQLSHEACNESAPQAVHKAASVDKHFDIVDAYMLDRRLRSGGVESAAWDVNNDGKVDSRDVDALARQAVAVNTTRGNGL